jgi:hypothetical protein
VITRRRPRSAAVVVLTALLLGATPALAQRPAEFLRVEWDPKPVRRLGWALEGRIHNSSIHRVGLIRVRVEIMNEAGQAIAEGGTTVYDEAPANGSVHFSVPLPRTGASYRVSVVSFIRVLGGGR